MPVEDCLMSKSKMPRPTTAELAILRVLWSRGPSTVREVQEELNRSRKTGYTTVLKLLQLMTEKGLVKRDESQRTHVYRAHNSEASTQKQIVRGVLEEAFGGASHKLVMQALAVKKVPEKELAEIRELLDRMEREA